ncbi:hypothetical protein ACROYT_G036581 [Oculina patagonica]
MGGLSSVLSASSLGTAVTVVGLPVSVPLAACAAITGVLSAAFTGASKKLEPKIMKNNEITSLAVAKRETVNRLVSAALIDNKVDDKEFQIILDEYSRYMALKETVRMHLTKNLSQKKSSPQPDIEKLRQEIRQEELDSNVTVRSQGPAVTLKITNRKEREYSIDLTLAIKYESWPEDAEEWPSRRDRKGWPNQKLVQEIYQDGCHLVAKHPKGYNVHEQEKGFLWRYSFSAAEKKLFLQGGHGEASSCWKQVLRILKAVREELNLKPLNSYHLKTILLYECEANPLPSQWSSTHLGERFKGLLRRLENCLMQSNCPHYFIPHLNLLKTFSRQSCRDLARKVREIRLQPGEVFNNLILQSLQQSVQQALEQSLVQALKQAMAQALEKALQQDQMHLLEQAVKQAVEEAVEQALRQSQVKGQEQFLEEALGTLLQALSAQAEALEESMENALVQELEQELEQVWDQALLEGQGQAWEQAFVQALEQALGKALWRGMRQPPGKAQGQAMGQSLGQTLGQAMGQALEMNVKGGYACICGHTTAVICGVVGSNSLTIASIQYNEMKTHLKCRMNDYLRFVFLKTSFSYYC